MRKLALVATISLAFASPGFGQLPNAAVDQQSGDSRQSGVPAGTGETRMPGSLSTEALIAKLQEESNEGIGSETTAIASGFVAIDDEPRFELGILGSRKPSVSPVMRELVRRGVAAMPLLTEHLSDARPTQLNVGDRFMGKWFADEYDPRFFDPKRQPSGVNTKAEKQFEHYTVRVGDLCFVAIGQIVNRSLNAVRYQPSLCLVVNSPVECPALVEAVKADWAGLTPKEHEESLKQDTISDFSFNAAEGLKRLSFYYPEAGYPLIVTMLDRPFFDSGVVSDFVHKTLETAKGDERRDNLLSDFRKKRGEVNYGGLLICLIRISNFPKSQMSPERLKDKHVADSVLKHNFPGVDPLKPPFVDAVDVPDQQELIEGLAAVHSKEMDDGVIRDLKRITSMPPGDSRENRFAQCAMVAACVKHLLGQQKYRADCRTGLETLILKFEEAKKAQNESENVATFKRDIITLKALLKKI